MDLALNNLQRLICHKTKQPKQTNHNTMKYIQYLKINCYYSYIIKI